MKKFLTAIALILGFTVSAQREAGTPQELAADEDVRTKYLGSGFVLKRSKSVERARAEVEHEQSV